MPVTDMINEVQNYPVEDRVVIADAVLQSINPVDVETQARWLDVAERRRREMLSGDVRAIPTSEVMCEAYARASAPRSAI